MSDIDSALQVNSFPSNEDEVFSLRKQLRMQEAEWKKNKAVLEQRIEILELQNRDLKEKEESLKKMNNSIVGAFKDFNKENDPTSSKVIRELEVTKQQISKDYSDYKIRTTEILKTFEKENKDLKERLTDIEARYNQTTLHYEKNDSSLQQRVHTLENEKGNLNNVLKLYEDELKQHKERELNQNELQAKISELRYLLEKQTGERRKEVELIRHECEGSIKNIKLLAESEKTTLETHIHKLLDSKKLDSNLIEDIKRNFSNEINRLKKERNDSLKKNETQEQQINALIESLKALEEKFNQEKTEHDKDVKELRRLKLRVMDTDGAFRKYEQDEKNLKQMITERDYKIEEIAGEFKKKLSNEKRRYEQAQELAKKYKDEGEKKCAMIIEESIKKDVIIKKLKGQLRNKEVKYGRKSDNDLNKSNTSLVNISLIGQSVSTSKFNPTRPFIQEVSTSSENQKSYVNQKNQGRISQRDGIDTAEEEDIRELTNRNILSEINSPRIFNNASSTYRSLSSIKKDPEVFSNLTNQSSGKQQQPATGKEPEKPILNINLYGGGNGVEGTQENLDTEESRGENKSYKKNKNNPSYAAGMNDSQSFSNISLELRKKSSSLSGVDFNFNNERNSLLQGGIEKRKITLIENDNSKNLQNTLVDDVFDLSGNDSEEIRNGLNFNPSDLSLFKDLQGLMGSTPNSGGNTTTGLSRMHQSHLNFGEELNGMRKVYSDNKIKLSENRFSDTQTLSEKMSIEKEKLQAELNRLVAELKQIRTDRTLSEESRKECELALKSEIKFLVNKLLQNKNSSIALSNSQASFSQSTKNSLNRSVMDFQPSPHSNTSGYLNFSHSVLPNQSAIFSHSISEHNNLRIINNNLAENSVYDSIEIHNSKKPSKVLSEQNVFPLKDRCMNSVDFSSLQDSKRNPLTGKNENSLLTNLLKTSMSSKKFAQPAKR